MNQKRTCLSSGRISVVVMILGALLSWLWSKDPLAPIGALVGAAISYLIAVLFLPPKSGRRRLSLFSKKGKKLRHGEIPVATLSQEDWKEILSKRAKQRKRLLFLASIVGLTLTIAFFLKEWGPWGKILSVLIVYVYGWTLYSRSKLYPYPGLTPERVGADVGEPKSTSPAWWGSLSIAITWLKGEFPAKPVVKGRNARPALVLRKVWAGLPIIAGLVLFLDGKNWLELTPPLYFLVGLGGISFWAYWPFVGWPAIRYTLGTGRDPDVFISRPQPHIWAQEVQVLWAQANQFNLGTSETRPGGAQNWDPKVMAIGGGDVQELMNFPWVAEWFPRTVLAAARIARK